MTIKTEFKNVWVDSKHRYYIKDSVVNAPSVTGLFSPSKSFGRNSQKAAAEGISIHDQIADFFDRSKRLKDLNPVAQKIINTAINTRVVSDPYLVHKPSKSYSIKTELPFVSTIINGKEVLRFVGCIDLVVKHAHSIDVVDWKSGSSHAWHHDQIKAYMLAMNASTGAIVYQDKSKFVTIPNASWTLDLCKKIREWKHKQVN